jgi:hypothetical protein
LRTPRCGEAMLGKNLLLLSNLTELHFKLACAYHDASKPAMGPF